MKLRVLVAYSSRHGSTAEIARTIGRILQSEEADVALQTVDQVHDLSEYSACVVGSAVYVGSWRKDAARFLATHEKELAQRPTWLFSSGPTGEGDPVELVKGWRFPEALKEVADRIRPRDIAFFHGSLEMKRLNLAERLAVKAVKAPIGDFRDWSAIEEWAQVIAKEIRDL